MRGAASLWPGSGTTQNQQYMMCRAKFPELESLVHHPIDYARVVKAIGNEMDITLIDTLEDILPQVRQSLLSPTAGLGNM